MSGDPFWQCRYNNAHGVQWNDTTLKWDLIDAVFMDTDILNQVAQEAGVIWGTGEFGIRKWQSDEKSSVMQGIVRLANKVGGFARFATLRGNQTVDFIRPVSFGPLAPGTPASTDVITLANEVYFYDALFERSPGGQLNGDWIAATAVHEMAHIIAYRTLISVAGQEHRIESFVPHTGVPVSKYARENRLGLEYWADSVMVWVYTDAPREEKYTLNPDVADWIAAVLTGNGWAP